MEIPMMSDKDYDALAKVLASQGSLALHEHQPDLEHLRIGLTWHENGFEHDKLELNLAAVLLTDSGQVRGPADFIFYNQAKSPCGSVLHFGARGGEDKKPNTETILIDLSQLPQEISKIVLIASVHRADERRQNFGLVRGAQVTLHNEGRGGSYIAHLDLTEDVSLATAAVVGELQRRAKGNLQEFYYVRMGVGDEGGIQNLLLDYGLQTKINMGRAS